MADIIGDLELGRLEQKLSSYNMRGQWQVDASRAQTVKRSIDGQISTEPQPAGVPQVWKWEEVASLLRSSREALAETLTARRSLVFTNPALRGGATQNLVAGFQLVKPNETAWAHRHTINALRFSVEGNASVYTVVNGHKVIMEPYDLVLTPSWSWHDHHNESEEDGIWLDALDGPFARAINQVFYEDLGDIAQVVVPAEEGSSKSILDLDVGKLAPTSPYHYPWWRTLEAMRAGAQKPLDPCHGLVLEYVNPRTGGPALPTIRCQIQVLPPGFVGAAIRTTASSISFVVQGKGSTESADGALHWGKHDSLAMPNWTWHRHINGSNENVVLFRLSDEPIVSAFGFLREQRDASGVF